MDIEQLLKALDNENNEKLMNMTNKKIKQLTIEVLKELELSKETFIEYVKKLNGYMYVEELPDLKQGSFIRWINIKDPENIYLTSGAIISEIKICETGINIVCKSFSKKHYQIDMDSCLIFQKLSGQEQVLLSALDHLSK
jgi:hypothetical protein